MHENKGDHQLFVFMGAMDELSSRRGKYEAIPSKP